MPLEIEDRYLIEPETYEEVDAPESSILQVYLANGIRIREVVDHNGAFYHYFTFKKSVKGLTVEIEKAISEEDFDLLRATDLMYPSLVKNRKTVQYEGYKIDYDSIVKRPVCLYIAEVEFEEDRIHVDLPFKPIVKLNSGELSSYFIASKMPVELAKVLVKDYFYAV